MNCGKLRHRLRIEKRAVTTDENGEMRDAWVPFVVLWGSVQAERGGSSEEAKVDMVRSVGFYRVMVRWVPGVSSAMRVVYGKRVLEIDSVLPDSTDRKFLVLRCFENGGS